jgi:carboxyl-terminal processing protease
VPADQPPATWNQADDYQLKRAEDFLRQGTVAQRLASRAG